MDVDVVYTYVQLNDMQLARVKAHLPRGKPVPSTRFRDQGELAFSLSTLRQHAPWIRNVYVIVANLEDQIPTGLGSLNVKLIAHSDIIPPQYLPTFNSHAIELYMHRIPGLAEHFIYMNDDMSLSGNVAISHFFLSDGTPNPKWGGWNVPTRPQNNAHFSASFNANALPGMQAMTTHIAHQAVPLRKRAFEEIHTRRDWTAFVTGTSGRKFRDRADVHFVLVAVYLEWHRNSKKSKTTMVNMLAGLFCKFDKWSNRHNLRGREYQLLCLNDSSK